MPLITELKPDERLLHVTSGLGQKQKKIENHSGGQLAQYSEIPSTPEARILELTLKPFKNVPEPVRIQGQVWWSGLCVRSEWMKEQGGRGGR